MLLNLIDRSLSVLDIKDVYMRDVYINKLEGCLFNKKIVIIHGQRSAGKSFIVLGMLKKLGINKNKVFYFNKDYDLSNSIGRVEELENLFLEFVENRGKPDYIIFDHIESIIDWQKFKAFINQNYKIIITSSNSQISLGEIVGKSELLYVYPFSYLEYKEYMEKVFKLENIDYKTNQPDSIFGYIEGGGIPNVIMGYEESKRIENVESVIGKIILKDLVGNYFIRDLVLLGKVLGFLADNLGKLVSIASITNYIKSNTVLGVMSLSTATISSYLKYLQSVYVLNKVERLDLVDKKILKYKEKYYFTDISIKNLYSYDSSNDITKVLQNVVYMHLKRQNYDIYVGEFKGSEITFVAKKDDKKVYIQVIYAIGDGNETKQKEFENLLKIKDNHQKIVVSLNDKIDMNYKGIEWRSIKDFLESFE